MFNLRAQHQFLYQHNMKVTLPILLSTRGYGLVLECYSLMIFHDDAFGSFLWTDIADELDYYFISKSKVIYEGKQVIADFLTW